MAVIERIQIMVSGKYAVILFKIPDLPNSLEKSSLSAFSILLMACFSVSLISLLYKIKDIGMIITSIEIITLPKQPTLDKKLLENDATKTANKVAVTPLGSNKISILFDTA